MDLIALETFFLAQLCSNRNDGHCVEHSLLSVSVSNVHIYFLQCTYILFEYEKYKCGREM